MQVLRDRLVDTSTRGHAAEALGYLGDAVAIAALLDVAQAPLEDVEIRYWSVFALGELGSERVVEELHSIAQNDHARPVGLESVSRCAAQAILRIREKNGTDK
jgi:HEAT repeat protein